MEGLENSPWGSTSEVVPVPPPTTALVFVPISGRALRVSERALWTMRWPYNAKSRLFIVFYMYRISF